MRLFLLFAFFACTGRPPRESLGLRLAMWGPLGEFSPAERDPGTASVATPWVFEKLVSVDGAGALTPVLAARVERLPGDSIRIEIRRDATFSDGTPVTGDDVVRSLKSNGLHVTPVDGGLLIESRELGSTDALLLQAHVFRESEGKLIGSGPFVVVERTDKELHLARRQPQPGRVNDVRLEAYPTPRDAFAHTLKGDANVIVDLESRWLEFFRGVPSLQIVRGSGHGTDAMVFNGKRSRSERIRLANLLASQQVRDLAYGDGECSEKGGPADERAALPPGTPLGITSWGPFERLSIAVRRVLGERGGDVSHVRPDEALARMRAGNFDLVAARPLRWPPSAIAIVWRSDSPDNVTGYSNPELDRAIDARDWSAAQTALRDDPPAAFICTRSQLAVVDARIKNPSLGPYELLESLPGWEVEQ